MQKIKHITLFFNPVFFELYHYIIFKLNNTRELQNIAVNHSADIDYKDFVKIYRNCTKEPYHFFTIDTTQPTDKIFRNNFNDSL